MRETLWFNDALDTLRSKNVNPMAAVHWSNAQLQALPGFTNEMLMGWRHYFYERWKKDFEILSNENGPRPATWRRNTHARRVV